METSDEELEWREHVSEAERRVHDEQQRVGQLFWWHIFVQILKTSAQITIICCVLAAALVLWMRSVSPLFLP